ncbi:winged helix-turn-helix domain-containing protein [Kosakonia sp. H02]|nr:winged helix-turn-helix domain-containing protein [Kosakonia sp. H02]
MYFIIDKEIYFRPADGAVWRIGAENEKRYLTLASSRLLAFFIENRGEVVSRDAIFEAVWERYGLHSSNNTLNQYISLLRRTLADFGLGSHMIKTIPKIGFLFSTDITVSKVTAKHNEPAATEPPAGSNRYKSLALCLLFLLFIALLIGVWQNRSPGAPISLSWHSAEKAEQYHAIAPDSDNRPRLLAEGG